MCCILVCGIPASGKSYVARQLSEILGIPMFSKDDIKERLFDTVGFHSREEKVALGNGAMEIMYYAAGQVLSRGGAVILENNFETASIPGIKKLMERFCCQSVTVELTGKADVLYERFLARDRSSGRHRGHVLNTCYPELPGQADTYAPISLEQFIEGVTRRGMAGFDIGGPRIVVDVTDFRRVDCAAVAEQVRALL
ncbi:AAA family ATPase [Acutalibacter muris]|uniref:AAA family ATPase n=1 Tax=Acutalibacter muris TaxID=1796620 RepID=A0A1Z2XQZ9_9FIRM|nr:AAA family ATPase [Acutalibacter muris]ANU55906.2 hypothetical protein A4V00_18885 [Hungateiclostridiaceae bacterium KB18]ASB40846.1 hypothetical protein ADH66_09380 [Acutalibacter muris]QQR30129.1 AAA family ATPase [Acutalibacter muris]